MLMCEGEMPLLPISRQEGLAINCSCPSNFDMIETNTNNQSHLSDSISASSLSSRSNDEKSKNYRNRTYSKIKLLVRSHAMRESTSPPSESHNNGSISSPEYPQAESEAINNTMTTVPGSSNNPKLSIKKISNSNNMVTNTNIGSSKQHQFNNNNEPIYNSNINTSQSPKQIQNSIISPTCQISLRDGSSNFSQLHKKNLIFSINNNNSENKKIKQNNLSAISKCNNCVKNSQYDRPALLQTPISPLKSKTLQKNMHNNKKNELRRPNTLNVCNNKCSVQCASTLSINRSNFRHKLKHQNSCSQQSSYDSSSPSLSRDSSTELYTDDSGIDLEQFIADTINRNQKDRTVLLKIEKDLIEFAKDRQKVSYKFPNMSSYNRMLVHRVAAYFGMEHNVDQSGLSVVVTRTKNIRIPDTRFKKHIRDDLLLTEEPRRSILKRESNSFEDTFNFKSPDRMSSDYCRHSKSFEEREEEYERVRRRIFKDTCGDSNEVTSWPYWSSTENSETSTRYRLLHPSDHSFRLQKRLLKGESLDSRESFHSNYLRPSVSKSFSFGGYTRGMLSRDDSVISINNSNKRLMEQDSGASMCSRLSPSSSGYKSQSQRSDTTISPSPSPSPISNTIYNHSQISSQDTYSPDSNNQTVMWAVSSISSVPRGSIIINPQTNQPYINPDGSLYRFDPDNPPNFFIEDEKIEEVNMSSKLSETSEPHKIMLKSKNDSVKRKQSHLTKHNSNCSSNTTSMITTSMATTTTAASVTHFTNSVTPSKVPFMSLPALQPPLSPLPPISIQQQHQHQFQAQVQQPIVRSISIHPCNHGQTIEPYATYIPISESCNKSICQNNIKRQTVVMATHSAYGQSTTPNIGQEDIYIQNPIFANYTLPIQHSSVSQSGDTSELSNYFLGMNIYDHKGAGDNQISLHPHSSQYIPGINQTLTNIQSMQPNYWQTSANQMAMHQTMYFISPSGTTICVNQNPNDRQQLSQQQRFTSSYSINLQAITPSNNYTSNYPAPYNSISTVTPNTNEYTCSPPVQVVSTYCPEQSEIQPSSVIYKVPTSVNTSNANQIPSEPLMYINSGKYPTPTIIPSETFGHLIGPNSISSTSSGSYIVPTLVPNLIFKQNLVTGFHMSPPGISQTTNRSPTLTHEPSGGSVERNGQTLPPYSLPMYQGFHSLQGDIKMMHSGVSTNSRLHYAPLPSAPVVQSCPRPFRPLSYASNISDVSTFTFCDRRNQKIINQRPKVSTLTSKATQPNPYQSSFTSSYSPDVANDTREAKPVEDKMK